jgi:hypothetical protein
MGECNPAHSDTVGHVRLIGLVRSGAGEGAGTLGVARLDLHADAPPVGFCEVRTSPTPSLAKHSDTVGQETLTISACVFAPIVPPEMKLLSICATLQASLPPVGLDDVTTSPSQSPATHSETDGQEIVSSVRSGGECCPVTRQDRAGQGPSSTFSVCQALAPEVGLVEVMTFPSLSTATHSDAEGQDTAVRSYSPLIFALLQGAAPAAGSVVVKTYPALSTPAQKDAEGQEIP